MKWTNKDWVWLLIVILALITSFNIEKPSLNNILSYIASAFSIALSSVAIYISVREVTKADSVKDELHQLIGELNEKVGQIDHKLNKIDIVSVQKSTDADKISLLTDMILQKESKH